MLPRFLSLFLSVIAVAAPPPPKSPSDAQIDRTLKAKLAKSKMAADRFTFSVANGVVTIEGSTSVIQHKGAMTRMARVSGAVAVRNNIKISDAAKAKATAALGRARPTGGSGGKTAPPVTEPAQTVSIPRAKVL